MFSSVLCLLCLCVRLFICALWWPTGKGLTSWLSVFVYNCEFIIFPIGILGQVWYLIVSIPDLCTLTSKCIIWRTKNTHTNKWVWPGYATIHIPHTQTIGTTRKRYTVEPVQNGHSKIDKTKVFMTTGSLMKIESIAECNTFDLH